jgi:solute carrier family 45 protein 1/2/4
MDALYHGSIDTNHRSLRFILALCAGWFGLQQILAIFYASGYFYLASLGFSDTSISLTWLSGPVAGMFFQPFIGALSDNSTHPWGKRRPFIVAGTLVLICAMLSLAWAEEIITAFSGAPRRTSGVQDDHQRILTWGLLIFVTACISIANLAIQPVQLGLRAMIVDLVPTHQQAQAHAWVAKLNLAGSIVGYSIGSTDLTKRLSFLGQSQFQILCSLVCLNLLICVSITCYSTQEKPLQEPDCLSPPRSVRKYCISLLMSLRNLSVTRKVCAAQFFCWLAWFPVMYYMAK